MMWLLDFLGCWLLAVGSWLLAVLEYTPIGLLGPLAGCLNCGSYEHGILIISLEKFSSVFSLASLQLARLVFFLVFGVSVSANIRQTFSLFAFFGCRRESVKTSDCTLLRSGECLLCSQFSPYLVLDVTLSSPLSTDPSVGQVVWPVLVPLCVCSFVAQMRWSRLASDPSYLRGAQFNGAQCARQFVNFLACFQMP